MFLGRQWKMAYLGIHIAFQASDLELDLAHPLKPFGE